MGLLPKDARFFELLTEQGALVVRATTLVGAELRREPPDWEAACGRISEVEREGDRVTQETIERLAETFITPFDPEDIHRLTIRMDQVLDGLESLLQRMRIYGVSQIPDSMNSIGLLLQASAIECQGALNQLVAGKTADPHILRIREIESEVDTIYRESLYSLFRSDIDPIRLWTLKEIYERLERAADRLQDISFLIEEIQLKNN
jgi:uncharacterized protein